MREDGVHQGWKRVALLLDQNANRLLVAGAFSGVPLCRSMREPNASSRRATRATRAKPEPTCRRGRRPDQPQQRPPTRPRPPRARHAHQTPSAAAGAASTRSSTASTRCGTRRSTLPLATVELSAGVYRTGPRGHILVGAHQQVRRLDLHPWCIACADRTGASHLSPSTAAATHPGTLRDPVVVEPACRDHARPGSLSWDTATALAAAQAQPVELCTSTSDLAGRTLRALTQGPGGATSSGPGNPVSGRLRCQCDRVATLFRDYGLKHYLNQLLQPHGPGVDGVWPMRCRACGTTWSYHRACRPSCAHGSHDRTGNGPLRDANRPLTHRAGPYRSYGYTPAAATPTRWRKPTPRPR